MGNKTYLGGHTVGRLPRAKKQKNRTAATLTELAASLQSEWRSDFEATRKTVMEQAGPKSHCSIDNLTEKWGKSKKGTHS